MDRVRGKVVLITGAASGLGLAESRMLAAEGAHVVMTDIDEDAGAAYAADLGATVLPHDVTDEGAWSRVMDTVAERFGRLDGLINNAGIAPIGDIEHTTTDVGAARSPCISTARSSAAGTPSLS